MDWTIQFILFYTTLGHAMDINLVFLLRYQVVSKQILLFKTFVVGDQIIKKNPDATAAAERKNEMLMLQLKSVDDDTDFVLVTYHMPCDPSNQMIAKLHSETVMRLVYSEYECKILYLQETSTPHKTS